MTASRILAVCLVFVSVACGWTQQTKGLAYQNPDAPVTARVRDLLSRMTLEEKVAQLESFTNKPVVPGMNLETAIEGDHLNEVVLKKIFANGLGTYAFMDEFAGLSGDAHSGAEHRNLLQEWVLKNTRLGIPILFHGEALHGAMVKGATSFPEAVGLGSTWDPTLLEQMFSAVAVEERALGNTLVLAPVFDLSRDPRYGRVEEMYSEDPTWSLNLVQPPCVAFRAPVKRWSKIMYSRLQSTSFTVNQKTAPMARLVTTPSTPCEAPLCTLLNARLRMRILQPSCLHTTKLWGAFPPARILGC